MHHLRGAFLPGGGGASPGKTFCPPYKVSWGDFGCGVYSGRPPLFSGEDGLHFKTWYAWTTTPGPYPALDTGGFFFAKMSAIFN